MSTDIVFNRRVHACKGRDGEVLYLLAAEMGSNNSRSDSGRIVRSWDGVAFGNYRDVMAHVTELAGACEGGCLQHGSAGSSSYREVTAEGFIAAWLQQLSSATFTDSMPLATIKQLPPFQRSDGRPEDQQNYELAAEIAARAAVGSIEEDCVKWDLNDPLAASAYAQYRRISHSRWLSSELTIYPSSLRFGGAGDVQDLTRELRPACNKTLPSPFVRVATRHGADDGIYLLVEEVDRPKHEYEAFQCIARSAAKAVLDGVDPVSFIRAEKRKLRALVPVTGTVKFCAQRGHETAPHDWQNEYYGKSVTAGEEFTWTLERASNSYVVDWQAITTIVQLDRACLPDSSSNRQQSQLELA